MADAAKSAVFVQSEPYDQGVRIQGPDFDEPHDELLKLLESYRTVGFQANGLTRAIDIINKMVSFTFNRSANLSLREADEF